MSDQKIEADGAVLNDCCHVRLVEADLTVAVADVVDHEVDLVINEWFKSIRGWEDRLNCR